MVLSFLVFVFLSAVDLLMVRHCILCGRSCGVSSPVSEPDVKVLSSLSVALPPRTHAIAYACSRCAHKALIVHFFM